MNLDVAIAVADQAKLNSVHERFVAQVATTSNRTVNGGDFTSKAGNLSASALGVNFRVVHRPIGILGRIHFLEYAFITEYEGKDLCLWCFYIDSNYNLCTDSEQSMPLCDYDNPNLPSKVVAALAKSLLTSPVFAPRF